MKFIKPWKSKLTCRNLIQTSAYLVVCEKECVPEQIKMRLSENSKIVDRVLYILEGLDVIRKSKINKNYEVLIDDINYLEKKLDLLFDLHKKKFR